MHIVRPYRDWRWNCGDSNHIGDIGDVARVQFASHAKVFDKKRKAVFDWEQFKEIVSIFYGFGKKDPSDTLESEKPNNLEELVNEELEDCLELNEAAGEYERNNRCSVLGNVDIIDAFIAGAEWQKDKDTEAVIVAEDRGFLKGADWARAEMMEGAVECIVIAGKDNDRWLVTYVGDYESMLKTCKTGDKVNIIILPKEEEQWHSQI